MMKLIITGLIISIFLIPTFSFATTSAAFLTMPISAKEAALGGAFVAVNREMDAVSYNPAGMSKFDGFGVSLMYNKQLFGNTYGKASIVHPAGFGMLGVSFSFLQIPFEETFSFGAKGGSKSLSDINLGLAFQRDITESFSIGLGAKFISVDLGEAKGSTAGADIGILYQINPKAVQGRFNIGAAVRNLGLGLKFDKESESLPMVIAGGIMYQPIRLLTIYGEVDKPKNLDIEFGGGLELSLFNILKPRVGYRGGTDIGNITAGMYIGAEMGSTTLGVDYAVGMNIEMTHLVELKLQRPAFFALDDDTDKIPWDGKNPTPIAVSDFQAKGVDEALAQSVADWLRNDWAKSDAIAIMARENMQQILQEMELQMTGITSEADAASIGEILNVKYMVFGSVSKVGSEYYINLKVVNIETSKVEATGEEMAGSKGTVRLAARKLALKLDPANE